MPGPVNRMYDPAIRAAFLTALADCRSLMIAAAAIDVPWSTVKTYRRSHPEFAAKVAAIRAQPADYRRRRQSFSIVLRRAFIDALARSGCAEVAARAVGVPSTTLYALKQRDMAFAAEWTAARDEGHDRAYGRLLHQAINGFVNVETVGTVEKRSVRHEAHIVLALLDRHASRRGAAVAGQYVELTPERIDAARTNLLARLGTGGSLTTMAEAIAAAAAAPATVAA